MTAWRLVIAGVPLALVIGCSGPAKKPAGGAVSKETASKRDNESGGSATVDPAIAAIDAFIASKKIERIDGDEWRTRLPLPPMVSFDPNKSYYWVMATTEGPLKIRLFPNSAPMHVSSTIYLTRLGYFDTLGFHRVVPGFMAQGGCPYGNGMGGPGYQYAGEFDPAVRHTEAGLLSMANAGPRTDGSQFFLTFGPTPHLDYKHTIFGVVVEGFPTLRRMEDLGTRSGRTKDTITIRKATIEVE